MLNSLSGRTDYLKPGLETMAAESLLKKGVGEALEKAATALSIKETADFWVNAQEGNRKQAVPLVFDGGLSGIITHNRAREMEATLFNVMLKGGYSEMSKYFNNSSMYQLLDINYGFASKGNAIKFVQTGLNVKDALMSSQLVQYSNCPSPSMLTSNNNHYMIIYSNSVTSETTKQFICIPIQRD